MQQSTSPGDSWLTHPALRRVVALAHHGRVRDMNGMFLWHEWPDNDIPTRVRWCGVITIPRPSRIQTALPSATPLKSLMFTKWFVLFATETVLHRWHKGPFWLLIKKAWRGSSRPPWMCFSHYHPIITSRKLCLPSRLIQHSSSSAAARHSLSTWKQQKLDFILIFAANGDITSKRAERILWNIGTRDKKK